MAGHGTSERNLFPPTTARKFPDCTGCAVGYTGVDCQDCKDCSYTGPACSSDCKLCPGFPMGDYRAYGGDINCNCGPTRHWSNATKACGGRPASKPHHNLLKAQLDKLSNLETSPARAGATCRPCAVHINGAAAGKPRGRHSHTAPAATVCLPGYTGAACDKCADGYGAPVFGYWESTTSLRASAFRQLLLGAQRARAGSSVTFVFAQLRGA
jgi:hypothetical protein